MVVPTNEELSIALQSASAVGLASAPKTAPKTASTPTGGAISSGGQQSEPIRSHPAADTPALPAAAAAAQQQMETSPEVRALLCTALLTASPCLGPSAPC